MKKEDRSILYVGFVFIHVSVPESCSDTFQRLIESLFITHADTKLNIVGHLDIPIIIDNDTGNDRGQWCRDLHRPKHL